jgi:transposase-like protein
MERDCIHILSIKFQLSLKNTSNEILEETIICDKCQSTNIVKNGIRKNKSGMVHRYLCKECGYRFTEDNGFKKRRSDPEKIALALDLYFRGLSVRKISEHFQQVYNLDVSHMTVYRWIVDYSKLASDWMDSQQVKSGERWHIDETFIKVDGKQHYLWNVLDSDSRYLLAVHVSKNRNLANTRKPIQKAKKVTNDRPREVFTDHMHSYRKAVSKELTHREQGYPKGWFNPHKQVRSIRAKKSNNRIERFHGTEKERIKVMRGFDRKDGCSSLMEGFRVHYNMVKNHQTLGCTPSEATGNIGLDGFRWLNIIKNSI